MKSLARVQIMKTLSKSLVFLLSVSLVSPVSVFGAEPESGAIPLVRAHAHNDYEHKRPLLDALDHGFCSVEADVHLVNGKLLVAHDLNQVREDRTLQALYLDPLRARANANGGRVFRGGPSVTLLIDFKSEAETTYAALRSVLGNYIDLLTSFSDTGAVERAITVVISGNRPIKTLSQEPMRYAAIDGRIGDLGNEVSNRIIPLISNNWSSLFQWRGIGEFSESERAKLKEMVRLARQEGRRVRFWSTPDSVRMWKELLDADVDLINADDLSGLQAFLLRHTGEKRRESRD